MISLKGIGKFLFCRPGQDTQNKIHSNQYIRYKDDRYDTYGIIIDFDEATMQIEVKSVKNISTYYGEKNIWRVVWPNPYITTVTEEEYNAALIMED